MKFSLLILYLIVLSFQILLSQVSYPNEMTTLRIESKITLDGKLIEPDWQKAQKISNFTQRELNNGLPVTQRTEAAILYDDNSLYLGVWCYDNEPGRLAAKYMKRDFYYWEDDNFEVVFDTFLDKRNGYVFVVNPNGARSDVMVTDEGRGFNMDWNGVWDASVVCNDSGWFAEIEIPFSTLKFPDSKEQVWGINLERNIRRNSEQVFWQGWSRDYDFEHVAHAGTLKGISNVLNVNPIELKPYISSGLEKPDGSKTNTLFKLGGDLNYLITPTLKLNLTANTDFAQVESDAIQINLSRFSLYYPEKREFFLEGKNFFELNNDQLTQVFYTRQIGISDSRAVPIIAGARLTGRTGRTNLGFLSIQTAELDSIPSTNYSVARVRQDIFEKSSIGAIITAKNGGGHHNYVFGAEAEYFTSSFLSDKNLLIGATAAKSQTSNSSGTRDMSYLGYIVYPNDLVDFRTIYSVSQKDFNPEIGFRQRTAYRRLYNLLMIRPRPDFIDGIKLFNFKVIESAVYWRDETNELESGEFIIQPFGFVTKSGDNFGFNISREFDKPQEDFQLIDKAIVPKGSYWFTRYGLEFISYEGRPYMLESYLWWGNFYNGSRTYFECNGKYNISRHLNIYLYYEKNFLSFGTDKFTTDRIGNRIEYSFNPKLYTSIFSQWNSESRQILVNLRLNWIPSPGSDLYFVLNQSINTGDSWSLGDFAILAKFVWRFTI